MPLYEQHLNVLNTANINNVLSVDTSYIVEADRKHIAVKRKNGTWSAHEITAKTANSITVSPAINAQRKEDIESIYYLGLYRFDADESISILEGGKSQVTVPIVELSS